MHATVSSELLSALNVLFTRSYYSAAGYVFESQPFVEADDEEVMNVLLDLRRTERQHARMLGQIIESFDCVPEAGAFPYWYRDLNYLTAPFMAGFVIESLEEDLRLYDDTLSVIPEYMGLARTMIESIRVEKAAALEELRPVAAAAAEAEKKRYVDGTAALKQARAARIAKEKAAKEAAKAGGAALGGMPDPDEDGITNKEKARRIVAIIRARKAGTLPGAAASGPSLADAAKAAGVLDPDEDGITPKEKGKRKVLWNRFKKKFEAEQAAGGGAAASAGPSLADSAKAAGVLDPDEADITPKEKGKRKVLWNRFKKKFEAENA